MRCKIEVKEFSLMAKLVSILSKALAKFVKLKNMEY